MKLACALLVAPALALADPTMRPVVADGSAATYGFVAERSTGPVFARQVLPAAGPASLAQSRVLYLNHNGVILRPGNNDSRTQTSSIVPQQVQIPAWNVDATTWAATVACFQDMWSRFDVQVVDTDPGNVPHIEAVFGGTPALVGLPSNVGGVSPFTLDCGIIENSIVFTFTDAIPGITSRQACEIMSQEVAHSFGLDHELLASDPMTYLSYAGDRAFQDQSVSCGEYSARACGINGSTCRPDQDSVQLLYARVGMLDVTPPMVTWTAPADNATVAPGFAVVASGTDNVAVVSATLEIDGGPAMTLAGAGPFTFTTPSTLAAGTHTLELAMSDGKNVQSQTRTVVVQAQTGTGSGSGADPGSGSGSGSGSDPGKADGGGGEPGTTGGCAASSGASGWLAFVLIALARRRRHGKTMRGSSASAR
jgi:uncharacterized protein (TIGR03382 family)